MATTESKIASQIERAGFELKINRAGDADQATINMDANNNQPGRQRYKILSARRKQDD